MRKKFNSKLYKSPIIVESINGDILVYIKTTKGREIIYSGYNTIEKKCHIPYINKCLLGGFIRGIPKKVLILGLGGGSFAKYLEDHIQDVLITGVDIDEAMIEISKKEMGVLSEDIYHGKAEDIVSKLKNNDKYDLILIDCYGGNGEIPDSTMNLDFFYNCKNILSFNGVVSINMSEFIINDNYENILRVKKYREMHKSLKKVFGKYFSLLLSGEESGENSMGIYNLDKYYTAKEIDNSYIEDAENKKILFDSNIIKSTYIDNGIFLN